MNSLYNRLRFNDKDMFYNDGIIDYSQIPSKYKDFFPEVLLQNGICDRTRVMLYFNDNKLLMPFIIILQAFCLEIHLANKKVFFEHIQEHTSSIQSFVTDVMIKGRPLDGTFTLLGRVIYIYINKCEKDYNKDLSKMTYVFYTSGTTGKENMVFKNQDVLIREALAIVKELNYNYTDVVVCNAPSFHSFGQAFGNFAACLAGCKVNYLSSFTIPSHILKTVKDSHCNILISTPYYYNMIYHTLNEETKLKYMLSAGGKLSQIVVNSGIKINNVYGTTETGAMCIQRYVNGGSCGSVGTPISGVSITCGERVFTDDQQPMYELYVESDFMCQSTVNNNVLKPCMRPFKLSDIGFIDNNMNLYIYGRRDAIVNLYGEKISLYEIEAVLCSDENVKNAKVIYNIDPNGKEYLEAYVETTGVCSSKQLLRHCKNCLSDNKIPRVIKLVDSLELSETGKIKNVQM